MWTSEQVLALSPDAGSTKNGKSLANVAKWVTLGSTAQAIWGECKGSGKKPYRTQIDLSKPAFKCSCPSRKFPCKHALGLFLLFAEQSAAFEQTSPPDWVTEWLAKRSQAQERKQAKATKAADPEAQAKRAEKRADKIVAGLTDLDQWLQDIVRQGLATLPNQPYSFWDQTAARLVDAQAPGLARRVRSLAGIPYSGQDWPDRMLRALGLLHLLVQGYQRLDTLSPTMQAEVRSQIGWTQTQDDLLRRTEQGDPLVERIKDTWQVLGKLVLEEERLKVQRVWLWGQQHQQMALMLSFAHGKQPLDVSLVPGTSFEGELIFYPGTGLRRAFVVSREAIDASSSSMADVIASGSAIATAIEYYAQALGQNPWLEQYPLLLNSVHLIQQEQWWLQDADGYVLPISPQFQQLWEMLAMSGGHPLTVFGEWDGALFVPLSLWTTTEFLTFGS